MSTLEGIMSTLGGGGGVEYTRGYHDKCGERSLGNQLNLYGNPGVLNIPQHTHDIPTLIMVSPSVLNTPWCTAQTLYRVVKSL